MKGELQRIHCRKVLSFCVLLMTVSLALLVIPNRALSQELELSIGNYALVSQKRVNRTKFDYTYRANLTNNGGVNALNVTATASLTSSGSNIAVVDGSLSFGSIPASSTTVSADTFTIRVDRLYAFNESDLNWKFAGDLRMEYLRRSMQMGGLFKWMIVASLVGVKSKYPPRSGT